MRHLDYSVYSVRINSSLLIITLYSSVIKTLAHNGMKYLVLSKPYNGVRLHFANREFYTCVFARGVKKSSLIWQ